MKKIWKVAEKNVTSTNTGFSSFLLSHPVKANPICGIMKFVPVITLSGLDQIKPNNSEIILDFIFYRLALFT
jgi:hypothetical protein